MNYPQPPWNLKGYAIQTLNLLDIDRVRPLIPPELSIVSVLPGKTLGGIYLSVYEPSSILQYNELIMVAGLTRYQNLTASWISHIYVDDATSVAGGREIWGLPKEMAEFTWEADRVSVRQDNQLLCNLEYKPNWFKLATWWKPKFSAASFSGLDEELLMFDNQFSLDIALLSGKLNIPNHSPFTNLNLGQPWLTLKMNQLDITANAPQVIGQKASSNFTAV